MAHNFSIKTTAVGVETAAETQKLAGLECDFYQGYLFGKADERAQAHGHGRQESRRFSSGGCGQLSASSASRRAGGRC